MQNIWKSLLAVGVVIGLLVVSVAAQGDSSMSTDTTQRTITVTGSGSAFGDPDMATIMLGVEQGSPSVSEAYSTVNTTLETVIADLTALGINENDIQTMDLSIFTNQMPPAMDGTMQFEYRVSNRISVIVRDLDQLEDVIDTAVNSGANNVFGLNFSIADTSDLEATARVSALEVATDRAGQIAAALGVELGAVQTVIEEGNGGFIRTANESLEMAMGGGGAAIERGQLSVSVSVRVTYAIAD